MSNLGKNWSSSLCKLVDLAINVAQNSRMPMRHGAVLFSSKNSVYQTCCNGIGERVCGFDVPSVHAEANCLKPLYNRIGRFGYGSAKWCEKGSNNPWQA